MVLESIFCKFEYKQKELELLLVEKYYEQKGKSCGKYRDMKISEDVI